MRTTPALSVLSVLAVSAVLSPLAPPALAAERTLRGLDAGPYDGTPEQVALAFAAEHGAALGAEPEASSLLPVRTTRWHGRSFVRLQQVHRGVPVLGATATVKVGPGGAVDYATAALHAGLTVDVAPSLPPDAAMAEALAAVPAAELATAPRLHVLAATAAGRLVYRVPLYAEAPPASWIVTVDAHSGVVLDASDLRLYAEGDVYPESPAVGDVETVTLTDLTGDGAVMTGTYAMVRSVVFEGDESGYEQLAVADPAGDFFFEPEPASAADPFVEVHTYHHVTEASRWLVETQGYEIDGAAVVTTNYRGSPGGSFDNAYFTNGPLGEVWLVFGQGFVDFAYDADVITHEFGHSVVQARTDMLIDQIVIVDELGWNTAPGALHEGLADYYAGTRFDDPCMAQYVVNPCMRDLTNDHTCPGDLYGEVHYDGLIPGGALWDVRTLVGAEIADDLVYGALGLIGQSPTFRGMAEALSELAGDLAEDGALAAADVEAIDAALEARGMLRCGRALDVPAGESLTFDMRHLMGFESFDPDTCEFIRDLDVSFSAPFQFAVTIPDDAAPPLDRVELTLGMERLDGGEMLEDDLQYAVYARAGEPVTLDLDYLEIPYVGNFSLPSARDYDLAVEGEPATVALPAADLQPGDTVYFSMIHMNCPGVTLTVGAGVVPGEPPAEEDDGCQCRAGGPARTAGLPAVAALLLVALLRRERRRG